MIRNQWYAIAPSKIVKPNKIVGLRRCGLDLALFRDEQGTLGCVVDLCTHRKVKLSLGEIKGDCLACPFHGIQFAKDGRCVYVPAQGKAHQTSLERFNVEAYAVKEAHGIIYLFLGKLEEATEELPFFDDLDDSWVYSEFLDVWDTHYSRAIENQLDVIHLPFIHRNTIGRGNRTLINGPKVVFEDQIIKTSASNVLDQGQKPLPAAECTINEAMHLRFRFPNLWMNHISDKIRVVIYFAPVDDEQTHLYIRFYTKLAPFRWANALIAFFGIFANRKIEREDKRVVITHSPKASSYRSQERLLMGDGPIILYRKLRDEYQNASKA